MRLLAAVVLVAGLTTSCGALSGGRYEYQPNGYTLQAAGCAAGDIHSCPGQGRGEPCDSATSPNCYAGTECAGAPMLVCQWVSSGGSSDCQTDCGGGARSRAQYKADIHVLDATELASYRDDLLTLPLATWRYKDEGSGAKQRLGYMLDEAESVVSSDVRRGQVDLYSYTSMTVAALKVQQQELEALKKEVEAMKAELRRCSAAR